LALVLIPVLNGFETTEAVAPLKSVNEYVINETKKAYHIDCFRIEHKNEVLQLGLDELIEEPNYFFIEWAEKIAFILPKDVIWVYIRITENSTTREISFEL